MDKNCDPACGLIISLYKIKLQSFLCCYGDFNLGLLYVWCLFENVT